MCRDCWGRVPVEMQDEVYRTVGMRGKLVDETWAPWWRAQARAIHHVAMLREPNEVAGKRYMDREMAFADMLERRARGDV